MIPTFICYLMVLGIVQSGNTSSTPPMAVASEKAVALKETQKDQQQAASHTHTQYLVPSNGNYPPPGQYPPAPFLMQPNPPTGADNSIIELKSDINTLRDTVMLLLKQNSVAEERTSVPYSSPYPNSAPPPPAQYNNNPNHGGADGQKNYDAPSVQIEVVQTKKAYEEPAKVDPPKEPEPAKKESALATLFPSLSGSIRANLVTSAERLFAIIKRGIRSALITGLIVAVVRLLPLLWIGLRLIFNSLLPLVGLSLQGTGQYTRGFSLDAAAATTVAAPRESRSIFRLDQELAQLEDNFDWFKGKF